MTGTQFTDIRDLDFGIEELDELVDPEFDVGHFAAGFATGIAIIALGVAVAT